MLFIGIDLGTSSVKLLLMKSGGEILRTVTEEYPVYFPQSGWSEQDPEEWFNGTMKGIAKLLDGFDGKEVGGISFGGQMHGLTPLDKDGNVIRRAILWNDGRSEEESQYLNNVIGKKNLSAYTGNISFAGFTAPKVLWMKKNEPENFAKIDKILLPKDYLAYRLSGVFATDVSDASGTLYFDCANRKWSDKMLEILGITEAQLPKVYESYEAIG
ncbi:MAG: FGGY family carbohydrate kinase, partial [Oscillospiraceae bacterium]|nr:FGGY family carbohydrate kinase [Oscillospiraceae bacterium]